MTCTTKRVSLVSRICFRDMRSLKSSLSVSSLLFSQHTDDSSEIQELTKYKPHVLLTQENTQIKELQRENKGKKKKVLLTGWFYIPVLTLFMSL